MSAYTIKHPNDDIWGKIVTSCHNFPFLEMDHSGASFQSLNKKMVNCAKSNSLKAKLVRDKKEVGVEVDEGNDDKLDISDGD